MIYVESEETPGTMLLQSKVMKKDVYQKQQGLCYDFQQLL